MFELSFDVKKQELPMGHQRLHLTRIKLQDNLGRDRDDPLLSETLNSIDSLPHRGLINASDEAESPDGANLIRDGIETDSHCFL